MKYAPLVLEEHQLQGYIVKSTQTINNHTIICEYSGAVRLHNEKTMSEEDSLMEYASYACVNSKKKNIRLSIVPSPLCNLARFISGRNNFDSEFLPNLESMKFRIKKEIHIFLYTMDGRGTNYFLYSIFCSLKQFKSFSLGRS